MDNKVKRPVSGFRPADESLQPTLCYPSLATCSLSSCCAGSGAGLTGPTGPAGGSCEQPAYTYVRSGEAISVVDPATREIIAGIEAPFPVARMGFDPILRKVYLVSQDGELAVIDGNTNTLEDAVVLLPAGDYTDSAIAVNPNNSLVYIASRYNPFVAVVNGRTDEALLEIPLANTGSVAVNPNTNLVYVSTATGLAVINSNTNTVVGDIDYEAQSGLSNLMVNNCSNMLVAADGDTLVLFDAKRNEFIKAADIEEGIRAMALDPGLGYLYVIDAAGNSAGIFDACSFARLGDLDLISIIPDYISVSVDPRSHMVYVTNISNGATHIVDGGMNQQIAVVHGTASAFLGVASSVTLACPSTCALCSANGLPGPRGATGARGPQGAH